uniref:Mitochondrial calcium uniporter regulator 1 n=1 Tax=Ursus maritimus TaxID=29073 RepID=A0A452U7N0_URSMA
IQSRQHWGKKCRLLGPQGKACLEVPGPSAPSACAQPSGRPCFLQDRTKPFCWESAAGAEKERLRLLGDEQLYFDSHALACLLEENGFTTQQAEIPVSALVKIMDTNMDIVYKDMVTRMQQEIAVQQIMSQTTDVKKDIILEKSEFSAFRAENEKINLEPHQLKQVMDEGSSFFFFFEDFIYLFDRERDSQR